MAPNVIKLSKRTQLIITLNKKLECNCPDTKFFKMQSKLRTRAKNSLSFQLPILLLVNVCTGKEWNEEQVQLQYKRTLSNYRSLIHLFAVVN